MRVKDICTSLTDGSHNPPQGIEHSKYLMLSSKNVFDDEITFEDPRYLDEESFKAENKRTKIQSGDVLLTIVGTVGRTAVVTDDMPLFTLQRSVAVLHPNSAICDSRFLMYALQGKRTVIESRAKGVAQKGIYLGEVSNIDLNVPSIEEQKKAIEKLDSVWLIIKIRRQQLSALDDLIKARFVEMFGDVITNSRGWAQYLFSEIATSRLGKMLDAKQQTGEHRFPYLANFNVQWFRFALDSLNEMDFNEDDQKEFELKDGDLLVCEGGEIGRCAVWHNDVQPCFFQKALHRVRCDTGIVLPDYLARWFQYNCEHGGFASIEGAKATIAHLPGAKLKALQVVVPPIELQERFISFVAKIDKSKSVTQTSLDETQLLFDSLMQKYFGLGELNE